MRLKDKVAIVTGAAHGMGEAEARLFAKEGAQVVVADILRDQAEAVAADIGQSDQCLSRHQARRRADGEDRWRLDRQHQFDHGLYRWPQRPSRLQRFEGRGADLYEVRCGTLWPPGHSGKFGTSGLHAADAKRDQRQRAH